LEGLATKMDIANLINVLMISASSCQSVQEFALSDFNAV